jgi:hypothetical protein
MKSKTKKACVPLALVALTLIADAKLETGVFVSTAQAVVGRPLTPVSYAGVARRTTRRSVAYSRGYYPTPGVW